MLFVVYMKEKTTGKKITTGVFLMRGDVINFLNESYFASETYTYNMQEVEAWGAWSEIKKKIT